MNPNANAIVAQRLTELLGLSVPPVAVTFNAPTADGSAGVAPQPAGCCFWSPAQWQRLDTKPTDHANCSVGSYTHGLIPLAEAAAGADTAALVGSGWVGEQDLITAAALDFRPDSITYQPLADAEHADVVLIELSTASLMTLMGAVPDVTLARKPQCVIVPIAMAGQIAVSPGCAVSRTRTGLPDEALTCAVPAGDLESMMASLEASTAADRVVSDFAAADIDAHFQPA